MTGYLSASYYVKNSYGEINASYNSIGQTGLIHLPSGSLQKSGTVGLTVGNSSLNKLMSVIATPFPWLEASFLYHRPRDTLYYGDPHKYLDKAFNLKLGFNYKGVDIALGFDDIAGTGYFTKEYIALTGKYENFNFTVGAGTGAFAAENPIKNPIKNFRNRPKAIFGSTSLRGGEIDFNRFFKGPIGLFAGVEFFSSRFPNLVIKIENNPFNYERFLGGGTATKKSINRRIKEQKINYGLSYKFNNDFVITVSRIKGNSFDLQVNKKFNFSKANKTVKPSKTLMLSKATDTKLSFYQNILRNLENDSLFLQSAELDEKNNLHLAIVNNKYNDPISVFKHTKIVVSDLAYSEGLTLSDITITNIHSGIETASISAKANNRLNMDEIGYIELNEPDNNSKDLEFQTIFKFPEFYNKLEPEFIYRYADPTRFFAGGIDLQLNSEIKFAPDLYLTTAISYQLSNSFKRLRYYPDSPYLPHVRTDVVKYLNNRPDLYLNSFQIDKLGKFSNGHYFKVSAGMYEMMFGGYGVEYLWKSFTRNISIGVSLYNVKQRDFTQRIGFQNYQIDTGHTNFIFFHPLTGLTLDLSIGKYLAGDKGYTLDFSRRFKSGFVMGAYFTRTNISKIEYGEGSFDKGFYFDIPLNFFDINNSKGISRVLIQPLTRDGGAKLKTSNPLIYSINSGSAHDYEFYLD